MIYPIVFWVVQAVSAVLVMIAVRRPDVGLRGFLLLLAPLPVAFCVAWGAHFGVVPGTPGAADGSFVAEAPAHAILASLVIWIGLTAILRGARLIAGVVGLLETASTVATALLATMQVTGSWL